MRLSGEKVEINELEEKVKMKRFWYRAFVFSLCAVLFLVAVPIQVSALSYNPQAAVQYASEHWNDGVGLCATFVSNCLKAGGCTVSSSVVSGLNRSLTESGYATRYLLKKTSTYYVYQSENQGKLAAGDPILFYCTICGGWEHAAICSGFDSQGRAMVYGHNPAWQNRTSSLGGYIDAAGHTGSCINVYAYRMIETHSYGDWQTVKKATCTKEGSKKRTCACGAEETAPIPAKGHDYASSYTVDTAATCTAAGSQSRHCSRCSATTDAKEVPMLSHSYGDWQTVKKATCTKEGSKKRTCACGAEDTAPISAKGHDYASSYTVDTAATCTAAGSQSRHCSRCSATTDAKEVPMLSHAFGNWQPADTGTAGAEQRVCATCGQIDYRTVSVPKIVALYGDVNLDRRVNTADAALLLQYAAELLDEQHVDVDAADVNGDGHATTADAALILQYTAEVIDRFPVAYSEAHTHQFGGATCDKAAVCACGLTQGAPLGHQFENGVCTRCHAKNTNRIAYTVVYDGNGGWGSTESSTHISTEARALSKNGFKRAGFAFAGWSTDAYATEAQYTDTQVVENLAQYADQTITLYAVWAVSPTSAFDDCLMAATSAGTAGYHKTERDNLGQLHTDVAVFGAQPSHNKSDERFVSGLFRTIRGVAYLKDDESNDSSTAVQLVIYGDGEELYRSEVFGQYSPAQTFEVDISGVNVLRIAAREYGNSLYNCGGLILVEDLVLSR